MAQTKPKAAQFYGVSDNGTDGQFLKTDGTGGMSWDSPITNPTITSIDYPGSATAADPAGGESVIINGTLFASGITCTVGGTSAVTAFNSATQITITTPAKAAGQYTVAVTNPDGGTASQANFIQYSGIPIWSTASGSLGSVDEGATASFQVTATEGSDTIEYAVTTGTLPTGLSLNTNTGAITGTAPSVSASTTTTFSITATDDENQTSSARSFNITVNADIPSNYFTPIIWTGNSSSRSITSLNFSPDLVWIKDRDNSRNHCLFDTVRGPATNLNIIYSDIANAQDANVGSGFLSDTTSNGFNLGNSDYVNGSGNDYVAWNFKAGGAAVANTDGTQTTQVSANNTLGFSIVSYSTNNDASKTFGHGLDAAPELIITKATNAAVNWAVYNSTLGKSKFLELNVSSSQSSANSGDYWNTSTGVNSTVFGYSYSGTTYDFISYCFTSKPGFSKVGSYTGNGTSQNISTGFKVSFVMIKSATSSQSWMMYDSTRGGNKYLEANSAGAEGSSGSNLVNFYTNGFGVSSSNSENQSGQTFIYLAFAADPSTTTPSLANSFDTITYTGSGGTQSTNSLQSQSGSVSFKPDMIWLKSRSNSSWHVLHDSVRGAISRLFPNETNAASTSFDGFVDFESNGFSLDGTGGGGDVNASGRTYVAWNWKAGGLPAINTDGSITSLVSANQAAGFSVVQYTGTGSNATIGHGLGATPQLIIDKVYSTAGYGWNVYSEFTGTGKYLTLNSTGTVANDANFCSVVGSSTITSYYTGSSQNHIAYFFTSIAGYSKVGSYTGSNASGKVITTGFQPSYVLFKSTNSTGFWLILDDKRTTGTNGKNRLYPNGAFAEDSAIDVEFTATGFTLLTNNSDVNGNYNYIYLAVK